MKAINIKTEEVVTNFGVSKEFGTVSYVDSKGVYRTKMFVDGEWLIKEEEKEESFDYGQFRAAAAINILCAMIDSTTYNVVESTIDAQTKTAIAFADKLIENLKETDKK